jgi:hypothetical protein
MLIEVFMLFPHEKCIETLYKTCGKCVENVRKMCGKRAENVAPHILHENKTCAMFSKHIFCMVFSI